MMVWEDYYFKKVGKRRNKEISSHIKLCWLGMVWEFMYTNLPGFSLIFMFSMMFSSGVGLEVAPMIAFLNIEYLLIEA